MLQMSWILYRKTYLSDRHHQLMLNTRNMTMLQYIYITILLAADKVYSLLVHQVASPNLYQVCMHKHKYAVWFLVSTFMFISYIQRRRFCFYGLWFEHFYTIQVYDIHFQSFLYTIYRHVHNVAFTFEASKEFIGIHISCLQLQLSMLCNDMVFRRS